MYFLGPEFFDWLEKHNIVQDTADVQHVIIDARCDEPVIIYVARLASTQLLELQPPPNLKVQVLD